MSHHHEHHHHETEEMTISEKLEKLMDHWVKHNKDHAETYETWAHKADHGGYAKVSELLLEAAKMNIKMNELFEEAARVLKD